MSQFLMCPHGHQWEQPSGGFSSQEPHSEFPCPVCGVLVVLQAAPSSEPFPDQGTNAQLAPVIPTSAETGQYLEPDSSVQVDQALAATGAYLVSPGPVPSCMQPGMPAGDGIPEVVDRTMALPGEPAPVAGPSETQGGTVVIAGPAESGKVGEADHTMAYAEEAVRPTTGTRSGLGNYEILSELGRGGMGVVYKARQLGVNRLVALKMILGGAHVSPADLARFRIEAESVGRLQHPHIVQVYEVGEEGGLPYFSLEFVSGGSLDRRLASKPQPPNQAARLVEILARAMHVAHQHGIIHRDLKPANVLLANGPDDPIDKFFPKIADFGLAKKLDDDSGVTRSGYAMGTPSYMSPEQAQGNLQDMGPHTDVYALGAILYEMLTGRPPFRSASPYDTILQVIREEPVSPARLQSKLPRDLETICLKCLAKDPRKRYSSAEALAEDLRRYVAGEPIQARPVALWERAVKWAWRHPAWATLIGVSTLAVLVFLGGSIWLNVTLQRYNRQLRDLAAREKQKAIEAETNFGKARQAVREMLSEVGRTELAGIPMMEGVRRKLLQKALDFHHDFLSVQSSDPGVRRQTGQAYQQVGDVYRMLGENQRAEEMYQQAVAFFEGLTAEHPEQADYVGDLATTRFYLAQLLRDTGQAERAQEEYRRAIGLQQQLINVPAPSLDHQQALARSYNDFAQLLRITNLPSEAKKFYQDAKDIQEYLVSQAPANPDYREDLGGTWNDLGNLVRSSDRTPEGRKEARADYDQALVQFGKLTEISSRPEYRQKQAATLNNRGILVFEAALSIKAEAERKALLEQARQETERAIAEREKLAKDYPSTPWYQSELAQSCNNLAAILTVQGQFDDAAMAYQRAAAILTHLLEVVGPVADLKWNLGATLDNHARLLRDRKQLPQVRAQLDAALPHLQAALERNPKNPAYRQSLKSHYLTLSETALQQGDHVEAARAAAQLPVALPDNLQAYEQAARLLARCNPLVTKDSNLTPEMRDQLTDRYAQQSVRMLHEAIARGFKDLVQLKAGAVFKPLADREDFRKLVAALEAKLAEMK